MTKQTEKRSFTVHPHLIFDVIKRQCGSTGKAIQEGVQNAIDAGASECRITLDCKGFVIEDDGKGFASREEIENCFETFGYPHEEGDSLFGKFRLGRGQLLSLATTTWETREFKMEVDIRNRGLDYDLTEHPNGEFFPGCRITGTFYKTLLPSDLFGVKREIESLMPYFFIPVYLNGEQINEIPADCKWDIETEDAWIKKRNTGGVKVYNLGAFTRTYPETQIGTSALVVTKKHMALNMSRQDILVSECEVWQSIRKELRKLADDGTKKSKKRLTNEQRAYLAAEFVGKEIEVTELAEKTVIEDVTGRWHKVSRLANLRLPLTEAPVDADRRAEHLHTGKLAFVVSRRTLENFEAENADNLLRILSGNHSGEYDMGSWDDPGEVLRRNLARNRRYVTDYDELAKMVGTDHRIIQKKDLSAEEREIFYVLSRYQEEIRRAVASFRDERVGYRELKPGESEVAEAWTDGSSYIVLTQPVINACRRGLEGFTRACQIILHEYLHDTDDVGSHEHDGEFFEAFHDILLDTRVNRVPLNAFRQFLRNAEKKKLKILKNATVDEDAFGKEDQLAAES